MGIKNYDKQDFTQARKYFERACGLNNGRGCNGLGVLYYNGEVVEKDLIKAAQFYSKACKLGDRKACEMIKELR
ncbi:hypothetical protein Taiwan55_01190 [Helicobacter pylori]